MKKTEYKKYDNEIKIGTKLFHTKLVGNLIVEKTDEYFIYCKTLRGQLPFKWKDVGEILFFSSEDCDIRSQKTVEKYAPYKDSNSRSEVSTKIENENKIFFKDKSYYEKEFYKEKQILDKIKKPIKETLDKYKIEEESFRYVNNGNSETYDRDLYKERNKIFDLVEKYKKIYNSPYFAKIQLKGEKPVYIGTSKIDPDIVDSRDKTYAPFYYECDYHKYKLDLVRHLTIQKSELRDFIDKHNSGEEETEIFDELLPKIIKFNREVNEVSNIAQSIQAEQYKIISSPVDDNLLVNGCAGSGKTMILLHRLSSIIFNEPEKFKLKDYIIISPNNVLDKQNIGLLPELDLSAVTKGSIRDMYCNWIRQYIEIHNIYLSEYSSINKNIYDNAQTHGDAINVLYQTDIANDFDDMLKAIIDNPNKTIKGFNFIIVEQERIKKHQMDTYGGFINSTEPIFKIFKKLYADYKDVCLNLSKNNVLAKIESLKEKIKILEKNDSDYNKEDMGALNKVYNEKISFLKDLVQNKKIKLAEKFNELATVVHGETNFEKMVYNERKKSLNNSIDTIIDEISGIQKDLIRIEKEFENKTKAIHDEREIKELRKQCEALSLLIKNKDLKGDSIKTKDNKFNLSNKIYTPVFKLFEFIEKNIPKEVILYNDTLEGFIHNNYVLMDRLERYENFIIGNTKVYFLDLIESVVWFYKNEFDISINKFYEFDLYYMLRGLQLYYGVLDTNEKIISIDEYQDYSPIELYLIKKMFPNAIFNLYGDISQNINEKGIERFKDIRFKKLRLYELNMNYRNGKEITLYLNKRFNVNMEAIGLPSAINEVTVRKIEELECDGKKRIALIVKSIETYDELDYYKKDDNILYNENIEINRNKINVIPIKLAKGLEFEIVYVYERGMTNNEKYVACSRALEELNIIQ